MSIINVASDLEYEVIQPSSFIFTIAVRTTPYQTIKKEELIIKPDIPYEWFEMGVEKNRSIRFYMEQPGSLSISYKAVVELLPETDFAPPSAEILFNQLPYETLPYLNPSRYSESDLLANFAYREFGNLEPGYSRVQAIVDWVYDKLEYVSGSTDGFTTASDVLLQRDGVCRDYAHLCSAFCRALGIPARYVAGYAPELEPPDFHGFFEAFLDGNWYLFDATKLAPIQSLVRISAGRDAADTAFANIVGQATLKSMRVFAENTKGTNPELEDAGIVTV